MNRIVFRPLLFLVLAACQVAATAAPAAKAADPRRFENEIAAFEAADRTNPPPQNAILFIGSSSIRKWTTLAGDFPQYKVINRGFGGSHLSDSVYYFDRIVLPCKPRMIVMFAGSNDINFGKTPEQVFDDFKAFVQKVERALPQTRVAYISISTVPSRKSEVEQVKRANQLISRFAAGNKRLRFIDVFWAMLGPDGKPRPDIFVSDNLHLNAKGYAIWREKVAPYLE
jgi:lysophospholipase L1-like esterase